MLHTVFQYMFYKNTASSAIKAHTAAIVLYKYIPNEPEQHIVV